MIKETRGDRIFNVINIILQVLLAVSILYPFIYLFSVSISDPMIVLKGHIWFLPKKICFTSYNYIMKYKGFWLAYYNTVWYAVFGTLWSLTLILITAYPLSRKNLKGRKGFMIYWMITMYFGGGLVPSYLLIRSLGLIDTRWVMVVGGVPVFYTIMTLSFFQGIPDSLIESAEIDGATPFMTFVRIVLPLSKAIISVMVLYLVVDSWNAYFGPLIYLNNDKLKPVQLILQQILISLNVNNAIDPSQLEKRAAIGQGVRYAMIIVTILPILCIYPFIQKYFVKGVMIGSLKG